MKISMGAKKYDLNHAAKAVLEKVTAAEEAARKEAAAVQADERYTEAYKKELIADIAKKYEADVQAIREEYAPKIDSVLSEFVGAAQHIQPRKVDERCLQTLQMLKTAPDDTITNEMIEAAAQSIGGDPLAIIILREYAIKNGLNFPLKFAAPPTPYLTIDNVRGKADEIAQNFRQFFDLYAKFDSGERISYHDFPEEALNQGMKPHYASIVGSYGNELGANPLSFGDEALDAQYAAECCEQ